MTQSTIDSPCINVCQLNNAGTLCVGCFRSREEIGEWRLASDDRKQQILDSAGARRMAETS